MAALENAYHNFPRLAKQSGFYFQLNRGRVNWSDIENLDLNEIIQSRNFELLEQNLVNVTNCNLEREFEYKILNQNFVKLFKLAQLGVDYLSYCEMYLDRCVVILQEQLIAYQDECELLKKEIQKRKAVSRSKSKNKTNHQCEKCDKVFISDVYLKFHEKRRHSSTNLPESLCGSPRKCSCYSQQSEDKKKLSTSTQTLFLDEVTEKNEDTNFIKTQHVLKVEKLEQELQDLKERLKKTEAPKSEVFHYLNIPDSTLVLLPSYVKNFGNGHCEIDSGFQTSLPEICQPNSTISFAVNSKTFNSKHLTENVPEFKSESKNLTEKVCEVSPGENVKTPENSQEYHSEGTEKLECEKENVDPKIKPKLSTNLEKPLPPPRKLKKRNREQSESEIKAAAKEGTDTEKKTEDFNSHLIVRSTPVKEKLWEGTNAEMLEEGLTGNISEINKSKANSTDSLESKKSVLFEPESKSFIKKIVTRDSPAIQKFRNVKKSLNNFYDSVSSTEKEVKKKEMNFENLRTAVVDGLNNHLHQLGISSEWSGIPRKTMKQKLSAWKHQKKLLSKENPLYPVIRQNIEEKIIQKLKTNFSTKKRNSTIKLSKPELVNATGSNIQNILLEDKSEFVKSRSCLMYDTDTDSESRVSDSLKNLHDREHNITQKTIIVEEITSSEERVDAKNKKEFDISVFQAGKCSLYDVNEGSNQRSVDREDKLFIDSDTESSSVEDNDGRNLKDLKSYLKTLQNDATENRENNKNQFQLSDSRKPKAESQITLKDEGGFQSKPVTNNEKKVLFANYSKGGREEELSDNPTDDDLWSLGEE